jgi:hypothetical protein
MAFSAMLSRVALVGTDVSEELSAFFIRVTRIGELGTTLAVNNFSDYLRFKKVIMCRDIFRANNWKWGLLVIC